MAALFIRGIMQPSSNSQQALQNLQSFQGSMKNPGDILSSYQQKYGIGNAQDQVTGLRGAINNTTKLLNNVAPGVMGRTGNSLVTSAQANRQIQNEQAPLNSALTDQGRQYSGASEDLSRLMGEAQAGAGLELQGQQNQASFLQNIYDNLLKQEQQAEAKRQFDAQLAASIENSKRSAAGSAVGSPSFSSPGASTGGGAPARSLYNQELSGLQNALSAKKAPTYEQAVKALVGKYSGSGISPQEIGDYVYQLYSRYFNTAGTKKIYG